MKPLASILVAIGLWAVPAFAMAFVHPGALNSKAELDFVKARIEASAQPWKGEFDRIQRSGYATRAPHGQAHINARSRDATVSRDDAIAAYTQALLWYFTDDEAYAKRSVAILNSWSGLPELHLGFRTGSAASGLDRRGLRAGSRDHAPLRGVDR